MKRFAVGLLVGVVAVTGCKKHDRAIVKINGTVTFDDAPVADGMILFRRTSGEMRGYGGLITNGTYSIGCEPGEVKVEITAERPVPGKFTESNGVKEPVMQMYIPKKYNAQSELVRTIPDSDGEIDFPLTKK